MREFDYAEFFRPYLTFAAILDIPILATQDLQGQTALASRPVLHFNPKKKKEKENLRVLEAPSISTLRMNPCKLVLSFSIPCSFRHAVDSILFSGSFFLFPLLS